MGKLLKKKNKIKKVRTPNNDITSGRTNDAGVEATIGELDTNGFLTIKLRFSVVGVFDYAAKELDGFEDLPPDTMVQVLRDESEVFSEASMNSLRGKPILENHAWALPGGDSSLSGDSPDNPPIQIGAVAGNPSRNGKFLEGMGLITNEFVIADIRDRDIVQVSPGYHRKVVRQDGVWNGQKYQAVFTDISYNHIALLSEGRARGGPDMRIMDAKPDNNGGSNMSENFEQVRTDEGLVKTDSAGANILGRVMDVAAKNAKDLKTSQDGLEEQIARIKELDAQIATIQAERDKISGELQELKTQLDEITQPANMQKLVDETQETQEVAEATSSDSLPVNWKTLPNKEVRKLVVLERWKKEGRTMDATKISDDFIGGVWDGIVSGFKAKTKAVPVAGAMDSLGNPVPARTWDEQMGFKPVVVENGGK